MRRDRKVNVIRSLKHEISYYKRLPIVPLKLNPVDMKHIRVNHILSRDEVLGMPKEMIESLIKYKMVENAIAEIPIKLEFDEMSGGYRATLDLWFKPKGY